MPLRRAAASSGCWSCARRRRRAGGGGGRRAVASASRLVAADGGGGSFGRCCWLLRTSFVAGEEAGNEDVVLLSLPPSSLLLLRPARGAAVGLHDRPKFPRPRVTSLIFPRRNTASLRGPPFSHSIASSVTHAQLYWNCRRHSASAWEQPWGAASNWRGLLSPLHYFLKRRGQAQREIFFKQVLLHVY